MSSFANNLWNIWTISLKLPLFCLGPSTLPSCGNLTLSGFQSPGGGGRPLNFSWSLKSPNNGSDVTAINNILSGLGPDADRIHIPGKTLKAGKTYVFQLGVANFLNPSTFQNVTHSVVKAADPVPFLSLSSSIDLGEGEVYVSKDLSIKVTADVSNVYPSSFLYSFLCVCFVCLFVCLVAFVAAFTSFSLPPPPLSSSSFSSSSSSANQFSKN